METVDEIPVFNSAIDNVKTSVIEESTVEEPSVCHKSNGVDSNTIVETEPLEEITVVTDNIVVGNECAKTDDSNSVLKMPTNDIDSAVAPTGTDSETAQIKTDNNVDIQDPEENMIPAPQEILDVPANVTLEITEIPHCQDIEGDSKFLIGVVNADSIPAKAEVKFETEILVEESVNHINDNEMLDNYEAESTHNILSDNIELSEVLRSSDVSEENIENNSNSVRQEVFNKEELLDILEGNDVDSSIDENSEKHSQTKILEAQIALKQLSRLQNVKKRKNSLHPRSKKGEKKDIASEEVKNILEADTKDTDKEQEVTDKLQEPENIVNVLVMDWQDDEPTETKPNEIVIEHSEGSHMDPEENKVVEEKIINQDEMVNQTASDCTGNEEIQHSNKGNDDDPPRRVSRVIKKKVIFDPDNPDTFTKTKTLSKSKDNLELVSIKKIKPEQTELRSKSKSPLSRLQWKKPSPKNNSKQHKRLSEVDKLLMDEGAVNMIYQLTPEAPKGKKNMKTKAEFIKKIQSSTPDGKEMKFRERKKESLKYEDGEAKRILSGRHRGSLSSSVKSPSVSEDFETHSADDSIIYRRHSSSSYSSSCMSPRRLSDVETGAVLNIAHSIQQPTDNQIIPKSSACVDEQDQKMTDVFMAENEVNNPSNEIINKHDCLSIKEKLNSKLSLALKKRKRDSSKTDKPLKQKKVSKIDENSQTSEKHDQFKFISVNVEQRLALICIKKTGLKVCIEVLKELEEALLDVDSRKDISVTLLTSQCGTLCSSLDLSFLLGEDEDTRAVQAFALAESVRSLLCSMVQHSKLICCGMWGACSGVALALMALSDVVLASECATFALSTGSLPMLPGAATLSSCRRGLPQAIVNDLVIFGRRLSASEALQSGLISRTLWPDRFDEQVNNIARDIAAQPAQTVLLKKKLLNLERNNEVNTVLSNLEAERDLLVEYWTSVEGQELLRVTLDAA